jgi:hypothetical protein
MHAIFLEKLIVSSPEATAEWILGLTPPTTVRMAIRRADFAAFIRGSLLFADVCFVARTSSY